MSALGFGALLVALWVLLWGSLTVANLLSGAAVVALVLWLVPDLGLRRGLPAVRPVAVARFGGRLLVEVVKANTVLTREVVSRRSSIHTGVVAVPLPLCSDGLLTLVANVLALTPGTMPVEVRKDPTELYLHVLHLHDVDRVRRDVQHLAELAVAAFGSPEAVAALAERPAAHDAADPTDPDGFDHGPTEAVDHGAIGAAAPDAAPTDPPGEGGHR